MTRPRRLRIGHTAYKVLWSKRAVDVLARDAVSGGAISMRRKTVAVEPLDNESATREVLLHEVLHGCLWDAAFPWGPRQEEQVVATLAPRLLQVLRTNPALVRYLTESD